MTWTNKQTRKWWRQVKNKPAPRFTEIETYLGGVFLNRWSRLITKILTILLCCVCCSCIKYIDKPIEIIKEVEVIKEVLIPQTDPTYYVIISSPICYISQEGWMQFYDSSGTVVGKLDWSDHVFIFEGDAEESVVSFIDMLNEIVKFTEEEK